MSPIQNQGQFVSHHLFIDDRFVEERPGLKRRFHQAVKCDQNPVIRADRPWEKDAAFVDSGLVVYDKTAGLFKAWYQGGACYGPEDCSNMCYATSPDGIHWDKPSLGLIEFEGNKDNNIVLMAQCMMHDPAPIIDPIDPDPRRRYKAIWWGGRRDPSQKDGWRQGHCVGFSPDGLDWTEHPENPVWPGDAEVAVPASLEQTSGKLVMYSSADGHGMRVIARTESDDFVHWDLPPKLVFGLDEEDPPGTEIAGLSAVEYEGTHVGMLWVARNLPEFTRQEWQDILQRNIRQGFFGPPIEMNNVRCRMMYTELVTSLDGAEWQRIHRQPLIPLGPEGSWDECLLLAGRPLVFGDKIYLYYTGQGRTRQTPGVETPQKIGDWNVETGLTTLRADGFASLEAGSTQGVLVSKAFELRGTHLTINADAEKGTVVLEVLDETGKPITGLTKQEGIPVTSDQVRGRVQWSSSAHVGDLQGRRVKLKIYIENARLYSVSVLNES